MVGGEEGSFYNIFLDLTVDGGDGQLMRFLSVLKGKCCLCPLVSRLCTPLSFAGYCD
jgi:hypothetical protein